MRLPYQSDSMRRARDVCKGICNRKILHCLYYCKYGVLFFGDDETGPADESKRTKRVQGWFRQIIGRGFYYLRNNHIIRVNMHINRVDYFYNSINQCCFLTALSLRFFVSPHIFLNIFKIYFKK